MSPESVRAAYERIRAEVFSDEGVTVVAATKYVSLDEMAVLAEAGVDVVGENRAQDLERKHAVYGDAFRWHFIGHLQSNKAKVVNGICELVHSLGSESAAARLTVPALLEVNLSGEDSKLGVPPERLPRPAPLLRRRARPDDHAPAGGGRPPKHRGRSSAVCGSWQPNTTSPSCRWAPRRTTASRRRREPPSCVSAPSSYGP